MSIFLGRIDTDMSVSDWLNLAVSPGRKPLSIPHAFVAADGYRMHIAKYLTSPCGCEHQDTHAGINKVMKDAETVPFAFSVNRQFLLDALAGMNNAESIDFFSAGPDKPIVIQASIENRTAIIMPLHKGGVGAPKLSLPKLPEPEGEEGKLL